MRQAEGREVVIVEAVRTPIGRGHQEKGYYKDTHPNTLFGKDLYRGHLARGHRPCGGRGRRRRLRAAVRRAGLQHRAQRVAAGGPADRDARHDDRPPVRLGAAGRQLRRGADRRRRARRDDRRRRRAHGPSAVRRRHEDAGGLRLRVHAGADGQAQHRRPGSRRRDDRRPVGDLPLRARRARGALAPARPAGDRGGPLRARDGPDVSQRRHVSSPTRASGRTRASRRCRSSSLRSSPTARSPRATRRRSPTAPPRCC